MTAIPVPELPLLAPWYRLVEEGGRLVLEHGHHAVVLEGGAVRLLLPRLLPLLDGTRTVPALVDRLGVSVRPAVEQALALLARHELLVEGPPPVGAPELRATAEQLAAESGSAPAQVAERLASARVGVVGSSAVALEVARVLLRAGVGSVVPCGWAGAGTGDALAVVAPRADELPCLAGWNRAALAAGAAWLQVLPFDGRIAAVGPLFLPNATACRACYELRRAASLGFGVHGSAIAELPPRAAAGPALEAVVAGLAAAHALRWLGVRDPRLPGVLHAFEPGRGLLVTAHPVLRVPRCDACSGLPGLAPPSPWFDAGRAEVPA